MLTNNRYLHNTTKAAVFNSYPYSSTIYSNLGLSVVNRVIKLVALDACSKKKSRASFSSASTFPMPHSNQMPYHETGKQLWALFQSIKVNNHIGNHSRPVYLCLLLRQF